MKNGPYRVRVNRQQIPNDSHCYMQSMGSDGKPLWVTGAVAKAAMYSWEVAQVVAQQWADFLSQNGYPAVVKRLRIVPATGGAETLWRAQIVPQSETDTPKRETISPLATQKANLSPRF